jgi:dihydroneopterin aldolase
MSDDLQTAFDLHARAAALAGPLDRISLQGHVAVAEIGAFEQERGRPSASASTSWPRSPRRGTPPTTWTASCPTTAWPRPWRPSSRPSASTSSKRWPTAWPAASCASPRPGACSCASRSSTAAPAISAWRSCAPATPSVPIPSRPSPIPPRRARASSYSPTTPTPRRISAGRGRSSSASDRPAALPEARTETARRRIALLALDQAAWALASRDPRLLVAGSRTELDWALRRGHPAVWAPSRLVLDTPDAPSDTDAPSLAAWIAGRLDAVSLVLAGLPPPPGFRAPVPVETLP